MPSNRCSICKIKVGLDFFNCSCDPDKMFCGDHRFPFSHNCIKDCKIEHSKQIKKSNPEVKPSKIIPL